MRLLEQLVFLILLILFPIQLGKHFWPNFAFVQGIRLDYLSPTLYLSDIFIVLLFFLSFLRFRAELKRLLTPKLAIICIILLCSAIFAVHMEAALMSTVKLLEFLWLGFYVSKLSKKYIQDILFVFVLGGLVQVVILLLQFFSQRSIGGAFYYLGERTFDPTTLGIAVFRFGEELILRPYGTFPHPNVLACYLYLVLILILFLFPAITKVEKLVKSLLMSVISVGIILTFSRVIIIVFLVSIIYYFWNNKKALLMVLPLIVVSVLLLTGRLFSGVIRDLMLRLDLLRISYEILIKNPVLGVGLNNFYYHEVYYQKIITPMLLQPVHNVYVFWLTSVGLLGLILVVILFKNLISLPKSKMISVLLLALSVIGLFDHYLITLQQGQLILAFVLGLSFSKIGRITKAQV